MLDSPLLEKMEALDTNQAFADLWLIDLQLSVQDGGQIRQLERFVFGLRITNHSKINKFLITFR